MLLNLLFLALPSADVDYNSHSPGCHLGMMGAVATHRGRTPGLRKSVSQPCMTLTIVFSTFSAGRGPGAASSVREFRRQPAKEPFLGSAPRLPLVWLLVSWEQEVGAGVGERSRGTSPPPHPPQTHRYGLQGIQPEVEAACQSGENWSIWAKKPSVIQTLT